MRPAPVLAALLALALLAPALPAAPAGPGLPLAAAGGPAGLPVPVPHPPILIQGDAAFLARVANGVVLGSGTPGDPYVIEGWDIATGAAADGIRLEGTRAHVVIRGNAVHDGDPGWPTEECFRTLSIVCHPTIFPTPTDGVVLVDAQNVTVEGNTLYRNGVGIRLERSQAVLRDNAVTGKGHPPLTQGCADLGQAAFDFVTSQRWPRLVQELQLIAWRYYTFPPTGILARDSDLVVEGGSVDCAATGLFAFRGRSDVAGLVVRDGVDGLHFRGGAAAVRGASVTNVSHAGYTLGDGVLGSVRGSAAGLMGRGAFVCGQGTVALLEGNTFRDAAYENSGAMGVFASGTIGCPGDPHVDIVGNTVTGGNSGIMFTQATGSVVGNTLRDGAWFGLYTQWASPLVRGNTVEGYDQGILLRYHRGLVEANAVTGNNLGAIAFGNPAQFPGPKPVLRGNALHGNADHDLINTEDAVFSRDPRPGTVPLDATGNWWGSSAGPDPAKLLGAIAVEPWLAAPPS